ncbi:MAG: deoxyribose-phosphate aldolase [Oscillospiraceae bacterium]|nr:deoxyribose-phosphate aldolase [Oscillospiraceae bacterium]
MNRKELLSRVDHTLLTPQATWKEIEALCREAEEYHTASVCIPPSYVASVRQAFPELTICTVIGFPNGYNTTACKVEETRDAVANGADEIDMVINLGWVRDGRYDCILGEIRSIREAADGRILKVIIETCLLNEEEKLRLCEVVSRSGADYIKTSTGFSKGGATAEDVRLLRAHCAPEVKVKAAGGISTLADAELFVSLGADRLGSSRVVRLVKEEEKEESSC